MIKIGMVHLEGSPEGELRLDCALSIADSQMPFDGGAAAMRPLGTRAR